MSSDLGESAVPGEVPPALSPACVPPSRELCCSSRACLLARRMWSSRNFSYQSVHSESSPSKRSERSLTVFSRSAMRFCCLNQESMIWCQSPRGTCIRCGHPILRALASSPPPHPPFLVHACQVVFLQRFPRREERKRVIRLLFAQSFAYLTAALYSEPTAQLGVDVRLV